SLSRVSSLPCTVPPSTELYTLSLHDALPIFQQHAQQVGARRAAAVAGDKHQRVFRRVYLGLQIGIDSLRREKEVFRHRRIVAVGDRKSTRLNSSHVSISYAVFCLKKKKDTFH